MTQWVWINHRALDILQSEQQSSSLPVSSVQGHTQARRAGTETLREMELREAAGKVQCVWRESDWVRERLQLIYAHYSPPGGSTNERRRKIKLLWSTLNTGPLQRNASASLITLHKHAHSGKKHTHTSIWTTSQMSAGAPYAAAPRCVSYWPINRFHFSRTPVVCENEVWRCHGKTHTFIFCRSPPESFCVGSSYFTHSHIHIYVHAAWLIFRPVWMWLQHDGVFSQRCYFDGFRWRQLYSSENTVTLKHTHTKQQKIFCDDLWCWLKELTSFYYTIYLKAAFTLSIFSQLPAHIWLGLQQEVDVFKKHCH